MVLGFYTFLPHSTNFGRGTNLEPFFFFFNFMGFDILMAHERAPRRKV